MRMQHALAVLAAIGVTAALPAGAAEEAFDACTIFTEADAQAGLGVAAAPEPPNPKVKQRPKVVLACTYHGFKESKAVSASTTFKFGKTEAETQKAFDDARLQFQTKPLFISGAEAFWSGKTGQLNLRKGRTWIVIAAGPAPIVERDMDAARKIAEVLVKKL
jgi:hypothetical protein